MFKYIVKRLLMLIPVIIGVTFIVFFILNLSPRRSGGHHPWRSGHGRGPGDEAGRAGSERSAAGSVCRLYGTLGMNSAAMVARMTRSSMLEVIRQDYISTARAKGVSERVVTFQHMLRNALIPIITAVGLQFGNLLGGAMLAETVFSWRAWAV